MATGLTKKQKEALTDKITGLIKNSPALRMTTDSSVNEMNINQISGELNRIHYRAIGKDLPAVFSFEPKQLGSGDPSPDNIRPIVGYEIDGIGTVYGGDLNIDTGVLTVTYRHVDLAGLTWTTRTTGDINSVYSGSLPAAYLASGLPAVPRPWFCDIYPQGEPSNAQTLMLRVDSAQQAVYSYRAGLGVSTATIYMVIPIDAQPGGNLVYLTDTPETYTLTSVQMLQLLDQL